MTFSPTWTWVPSTRVSPAGLLSSVEGLPARAVEPAEARPISDVPTSYQRNPAADAAVGSRALAAHESAPRSEISPLPSIAALPAPGIRPLGSRAGAHFQ